MRRSVFGVSMFCLLAAASSAAAQPHQTFNGFFIGASLDAVNNGPSATLNDDRDETPANELITASLGNSVGAGVQAGYNFQMNNIVVGVVGDTTWLQNSATVTTIEPDTVKTTLNDISSLRLRLGISPTENVLLFGTIGEGWARFNNDYHDQDEASNVSTSVTANGLAFGGGAALLLGENGFVDAEYVHYNFGSDNIATGPAVLKDHSDALSSLGGVDTFRIGVNFKTSN